jgi:YfiH family protein
MVTNPDHCSWIPAAWAAPSWIKAGITTRQGGQSQHPYTSFNLATHVGDNSLSVEKNRDYLARMLNLPAKPIWLEQIHGNRIICADQAQDYKADGLYTDRTKTVCAIMTADCVPILMCNTNGSRVAAIHVGWKGFCAGILGQSLDLFTDHNDELLIWIGPHIYKDSYEVGNDVRDAVLNANQQLSDAFSPNQRGRWQASLEFMIRYELESRGVSQISSANLCTLTHAEDFYSFRRDGKTGRMASLIWIDR